MKERLKWGVFSLSQYPDQATRVEGLEADMKLFELAEALGYDGCGSPPRGRLNFGIGRAYQPHEFAGLGVPMDQSREMFNEGIELILRAWTEDKITGHHLARQLRPGRPSRLVTAARRPVQLP